MSTRVCGLLAVLLLPLCAAAADDPRATALGLFQARKYPEAAQSLEPLQRKSPKDAELLYALGVSYLYQTPTRAEPAVEALREAVKLAPTNIEYRLRLGEALGAYVNEVGMFSKLGIAHEIRDTFLKAVELQPDSLDARDGLMQFYLSAPGFAGGDEDKAREQAAEIARRNAAKGHAAYAKLAYVAHNYEQAFTEYKAAIAAAPADEDVRWELAAGYQEQKRYEEAFAAFEDLLKLNPKKPRALYQLGKTAVLASQRLARGEEVLKAYLAAGPGAGDPPLSAAHWRLGQLYELDQRRDEARQEYEAALKLDPKFAEAATSLKKLGKS